MATLLTTLTLTGGLLTLGSALLSLTLDFLVGGLTNGGTDSSTTGDADNLPNITTTPSASNSTNGGAKNGTELSTGISTGSLVAATAAKQQGGGKQTGQCFLHIA
jgi:hypothetical protein